MNQFKRIKGPDSRQWTAVFIFGNGCDLDGKAPPPFLLGYPVIKAPRMCNL